MQAYCKIGIALPMYKRQAHYTLSPLLTQDLTNVSLYISMDNKGQWDLCGFEEMSGYESAFKKVQYEDKTTGLVANTFNALDMAFRDGSEWVLYLEDDLVPSKDIMSLIRYHIANNGTRTLCLCNLDCSEDVGAIFEGTDMIGWGFLINRNTFNLIREVWFNPPMWDFSVAWYLKNLGHSFMFPEVSRIKHIGNNGTHIRSDKFNKELQKNLKFYDGDDNINYYIKSK